jgi:hypothetical protein
MNISQPISRAGTFFQGRNHFQDSAVFAGSEMDRQFLHHRESFASGRGKNKIFPGKTSRFCAGMTVAKQELP